jgi:hypothetical protein
MAEGNSYQNRNLLTSQIHLLGELSIELFLLEMMKDGKN